ncbi:MAG: hypothetical protein ACLT9S_02045 [Faecalibacterium sp.]
MVNYTVKRYFFEQSAVREFYSGAYYDLFLVMRGSGVLFRCSEVVLPAQQQNLIIFNAPVRAADWNTPVLTARWNLFGCSCPSRRWRGFSDRRYRP